MNNSALARGFVSPITRARPSSNPSMSGDCYTGQKISQDSLASQQLKTAVAALMGKAAYAPPADDATNHIANAIAMSQMVPAQGIPPVQGGAASVNEVGPGSTAGVVATAVGFTIPAGATAVLRLRPNFAFKAQQLVASFAQAGTGLFVLTDIKSGGISVWPNAGFAMPLDAFTMTNTLCPVPMDFGLNPPQVPLDTTIINTDAANAHNITLFYVGKYLRGGGC